MKKLNLLLRFTLGILILYTLSFKIGFREIFSNLISINYMIIIAVFSTIIITLMIGSLNLRILLYPLKIKIPLLKVLRYTMVSWAMGLFVPGKIGEFSLIPLLKKEGVPIGHGAVVSLLDKLITLITLSLFSIVGFILFFDTQTTFKLIFFLFFLIIFILFFIISEKSRNIIKKYILRKYSSKFEGFSKLFFHYLKKQKALLTLNLIITSFKWFINSILIYFLFLYYGSPVSLLFVFLITSILVVITLIPITISGLGLKESAAILLYSQLGIESSVILVVYLIQLIFSYLLGTIIILSTLKETKISS